MKIVALRCEGFRSYAGAIDLTNLGQVTALVGRNNAGKSNLLELLKFLRAPAANQGRFDDYVARGLQAFSADITLEPDETERSETIADLYGNNTPQGVGAQLNGFLREIHHEFTYDRLGVKSALVTISNVLGKPLLVWHAQIKPAAAGRPTMLQVMSMDLPEACKRQAGVIDLVEKLEPRSEGNPSWNFFDPPTAIEPVPKLILGFYNRIHWVDAYRKADSQQPPQERRELSPSGQDLAQVLNHLASDDSAQLSRIDQGLSEVIRGVGSPGAPLRGGTNATVRFGEGADRYFSLPNAATGTHQAAIILTKLETGPKRGVFLIEEPESHLHPGAQRRLRRLLERESAKEQIFLTTHSTIFGLAGGATVSFLVRRKNGASLVSRSLNRDDALSLLLELGHSHSDLLGHDSLVCLEGDSEMIAIPRIAAALDIDLEALGIGLFNLHGRSGVRRLKELLTYLQAIGVLPFLALDSEPDVPAMVDDLARRSLLRYEDVKVWPADFEDLFPPTVLSKACERIEIAGVPPEVFDGRSRAVQILERILRERNHSKLDKPALAGALASACEEDPTQTPSAISEFLGAVKLAASSRIPD